MAARIKKNDSVMIIAGKERGKIGKVIRVQPQQERAVVERLNMVKRHVKPRGPQDSGGILEKEASIHLSNLMLVDPQDGRPTRVGFKVVDGRKMRVSRRTGNVLD
ncbi:MAG: 50S ribosomal protein L24 [Desulfurellaceae bacterium]|nr:50S ribosomal protein L24 [Desulfurellaceae bacterium]